MNTRTCENCGGVMVDEKKWSWDKHYKCLKCGHKLIEKDS